MAHAPHHCDVCGFDSRRWSDDDVQRTIAHRDDLIGYVVDGAAGAHGDVAEPFTIDVPVLSDDDGAVDPIVRVHRIMHHLYELARWRAQTDPAAPMKGVVVGLHASGGGVPKQALAVADVDLGGIVGDAQSDRRNHGRPWQALCLFSAEVIGALNAEGHSIGPGAVGENITIAGLDWSRLRGGLTVTIGAVRCRISAPTNPCYKIEGCFVDDDFRRIHHGRHPGWSRWYASVLHGGTIRRGDPVTVAP